VNSGGFRKYDYGPDKNLEVYGQEIPPEYDFTKITAPIALYWAQNDWLGVPSVRFYISSDILIRI